MCLFRFWKLDVDKAHIFIVVVIFKFSSLKSYLN